MKKIQYLFATLVLSLGLASCGDSFLTQYPEGGVMLEDQYNSLTEADKLEGAVFGLYSKLYEYGDHSTFGERSIDMYGDIQCGDMAMQRTGYGWFEVYERGLFRNYATSYLWSYYYEIIHLANLGMIGVEKNKTDIMTAKDAGVVTDDDLIMQGYYYGQLLAIRGWAYDNLLTYYCNPMDMLANTMDVELSIPIYTTKEVMADTAGTPRATIEQVYERIYEDLSDAIDLLEFYGQYYERDSKLEINADVARIILAYSMLNHGNSDNVIIADGKNAYEIALEKAKEVIDGGKFPIMKYKDLTATGFADVKAENWMWGQDVTVETTTALGSFFGQVDIHSYSYAAAGDTKGIDSKLYDLIAAKKWDGRINWFRSPSMTYSYCPDGKFFNPSTRNVTDLREVDRNWLCDNIFMRSEVAYLIAAEAAWANNDEATAVSYLKQLCDERVIPGQETEYSTWLAGLTGTNLKEALIYNWRVEMWGEGYGLQTLRRLNKSVALGTNHVSRANAELSVATSMEEFQCEIPSSEASYNPNLVSGTPKTQLIHQ